MKRIVVALISVVVLACTMVSTPAPQIEKSKMQPVTSTPTSGGRGAEETPTSGAILITPEVVVEYRNVVVIAEILRVRECPSTNCPVLGYIYSGDIALVGLERSGNDQCERWATYKNGWICLDWTEEK